MKLIKKIGVVILIGLIIFFIWDKFTQKEEVIKVPVKIEIPIPSKKGKSDTLKINKYKSKLKSLDSLNSILYKNNKKLIVKNTSLKEKNRKLIKQNNKLINKFKKSSDSLKEQMYKEAIAIKEYNKVYSDSNQTVNVYSKTRGSLLEQSISYKINKSYITVDTIVKHKFKKKFKVFGLIETGARVFNIKNIDPVFKGSIIFKNSKDNAISVGFDTEKKVWLGYMFKF